MRPAFGIGLALTLGCGRIGFDPHAADATGDDDARADGDPVDADVATSCLAPGDGTTGLSTGDPCAPWGVIFQQSATVTALAGEIDIAIQPNTAQSSGGCFANTARPFGAGGEFVEVLVAPTPNAITQLHMNNIPNTQGFFLSRIPGSVLRALDSGSLNTTVPYDDVAMRWWRMRPDPGTGGVRFEYGPDGRTWTLLAISPLPAPSSIQTQLTAGVGTADPNPGTARIGSIDVCPP